MDIWNRFVIKRPDSYTADKGKKWSSSCQGISPWKCTWSMVFWLYVF